MAKKAKSRYTASNPNMMNKTFDVSVPMAGYAHAALYRIPDMTFDEIVRDLREVKAQLPLNPTADDCCSKILSGYVNAKYGPPVRGDLWGRTTMKTQRYSLWLTLSKNASIDDKLYMIAVRRSPDNVNNTLLVVKLTAFTDSDGVTATKHKTSYTYEIEDPISCPLNDCYTTV